MKRMTSFSLILLAVTVIPSLSVHAEPPVVFKPPQSGAPTSGTVGGGTRSINLKDLSAASKQESNIQLLATKKIGLSSSVAPTLYWYTPKSSSDTVKLTIRQNENAPLLEKNIGTIKKAGIQTIHLADYGVNLVAGQDYTWSITVAGKSKHHSAAEASASIRYELPATPLTEATQMSDAGYWYDAVKQLIETNSPDLNSFLQHEGISITVNK